MPRPTMADTAVELLTTDPALTTDAIVAVVIERGQTRAKDPVAAVRAALDADHRLEQLPDGRWVAPISLLDGAVLTHVLDEDEVRTGALMVAPDLLPFWRAVVARVPLASGGHAGPLPFDRTLHRIDQGMDIAIVGPAGWLPFAAGAFLHVRLSGGVLSVTEGRRPGAAARMAERRLAMATRDALETDLPDHPEDLGVGGIARMVFRAVLDAPGLLLDPIRPLGEVLTTAGLEVHDDEVGLPGTDWTDRGWPDEGGDLDDLETDELDVDAELAELREAYDLTDGEVETLRLLLVALTMESAGAPITDADTLARLAQLLAQASIAELIAERAWHDDAVGTLAARILPAAAPEHRHGVRYLLAMAADAREQPQVAETHLRAGLADDPVFAPSLIALAGLSEDRGRYVEALELLKRAQVPSDDPYRSFLESSLRPAGGWPGRNEPCACGSGRKTKVCHPDGPDIVTINAGERLVRKLHAWADRPENDERVHTLLDMMGMQEPAGDDDGDDEDPAWWMAHTLAADILLFDRGELDRFLSVRGPLLPADEATLARSWRTTRRSLVQVRAIDPGMGVTVLDLVDGSVRHIADRRMSRELDRMDLVCTRVLPDGSGGFISDEAILIPEPARARVQGLVAGGDGMALLAWMIAPSGSEIVH